VSLRDFLLQVAVAVIAAAVVALLGHALIAVAVVLAAVLGLLFQQQRVIGTLQRDTRMLVDTAITSASVLRDADAADKIAAAADQAFRMAAQRRAHEEEHGGAKHHVTGTHSSTFENAAKQHLSDWERRYDDLSFKFGAFGFRVFPPSEPSDRIEGKPTPDAVKLACEREALSVAANALRAANPSNVSFSPPTTEAGQSN
jgi:hypothetical protein